MVVAIVLVSVFALLGLGAAGVSTYLLIDRNKKLKNYEKIGLDNSFLQKVENYSGGIRQLFNDLENTQALNEQIRKREEKILELENENKKQHEALSGEGKIIQDLTRERDKAIEDLENKNSELRKLGFVDSFKERLEEHQIETVSALLSKYEKYRKIGTYQDLELAKELWENCSSIGVHAKM